MIREAKAKAAKKKKKKNKRRYERSKTKLIKAVRKINRGRKRIKSFNKPTSLNNRLSRIK